MLLDPFCSSLFLFVGYFALRRKKNPKCDFQELFFCSLFNLFFCLYFCFWYQIAKAQNRIEIVALPEPHCFQNKCLVCMNIEHQLVPDDCFLSRRTDVCLLTYALLRPMLDQCKQTHRIEKTQNSCAVRSFGRMRGSTTIKRKGRRRRRRRKKLVAALLFNKTVFIELKMYTTSNVQ